MKIEGRAGMASSSWLAYDVTRKVLNRFMSDFQFNGSQHDLVLLPAPDPGTFSDAESFRAAYWRSEMWSKYPFNIKGIDREATALAAFREYETRCADANSRLADLWTRPIPEGMRRVLREARRLMHHLFDGFTVDEVIQHCRWGPGASTSMPRAQATPQNKWLFACHCTKDVLPWFQAFNEYSGWKFSDPEIVEGNMVVTVPKNAKTDRTIAIEPDWNSFFQLGVGGAIRGRLQRTFGLLQKIAQQVNQRLAKAGSMDGLLATIDLKGASDGVSLALVEALVPENVYRVLLDLRSPKGLLPSGETVTYEKISSMGNGYTFELETAIFYCLCKAASGHAVTYGDDIVVVASAASRVLDVLSFCGFVVNEKKTFTDGPFRESCGGHYFQGVDVTPPYVRKPLKGPARLSFCNTVSRLCDNGHWRDSIGFGVWKACSSGIPSYMDGPSYIDGVLHTDLPRKLRRAKRLQCYTGPRCVETFKPAVARPFGGYLQALWSHPDESQWRFNGYERPPGLPVVRFTKWVGAWAGVSPWSCREIGP